MPRPTRLALALTLLLVARPAGAEEVEGPIYKSWAACKVGTTVEHRSLTEMKGRTVETTTTYRLVELTPQKAVIEMVNVSDATGHKTKTAPQRLEHRRMFPLLPGVKKEDIGKPDGVIARGEETLMLGGKSYKAQWFETKSRTEAGEAITRTWMSDEVPGKLLKSVTKVAKGDKTTTLELTAIKAP